MVMSVQRHILRERRPGMTACPASWGDKWTEIVYGEKKLFFTRSTRAALPQFQQSAGATHPSLWSLWVGPWIFLCIYPSSTAGISLCIHWHVLLTLHPNQQRAQLMGAPMNHNLSQISLCLYALYLLSSLSFFLIFLLSLHCLWFLYLFLSRLFSLYYLPESTVLQSWAINVFFTG